MWAPPLVAVAHHLLHLAASEIVYELYVLSRPVLTFSDVPRVVLLNINKLTHMLTHYLHIPWYSIY